MTNKRQKFGCDPYLPEKKGTQLELVRVNYFQPFHEGLESTRFIIWDWDLNLGRKELGIQPSWIVAYIFVKSEWVNL